MSPSSIYLVGSDSDDDEQGERILEIDLDTIESARAISIARRATTSNFRDDNPPAQENFDIAASMLHFSSDIKKPSIRVITRSPGSDQLQKTERWIHLAAESIMFEDFKRIALNITLDYHDSWAPVVMHLLNHIKDTYEQSSAHGKYIQPGTVVRCDGTERHYPDKPDISVVFVSYPYFEVSADEKLPKTPTKSQHVTRSLFQQFYPQEVTTDRDANQQFRSFRQAKHGQHLRVPQIWALILNSTTTITCSPKPLIKTAENWLEIIPEDCLLSTSHCLIHVTDFHKRVTWIESKQCRSYLALEHSIQQECLSKIGDDINRCLLHLGDDDAVLDPVLWPTLLQETRTAFLYIRISHQGSGLHNRSDRQLAVEVPKSRLIEYTNLDSDEGSAHNMDLVLVRKELQFIKSRSETNTERSSKSADDPITPLGAARTRLEAEGYVVNTEEELETNGRAVAHMTKPKIFRRPTVANEVETTRHISVSTPKLSQENGRTMNVARVESFPESEHRDLPSGVKKVHFYYASSGEVSGSEGPLPTQSDSPNLARQSENGGSDDDTRAGALDSSPRKCSDCNSVASKARPVEKLGQSTEFDEKVDSQLRSVQAKEFAPSVGFDDIETQGRTASPLKSGPDHSPSVSASRKAFVIKSWVDSVSRSKLNRGVQAASLHRAKYSNEDLKQVIRDEITAVLKHNDDRVEAQFKKRHEASMRAQLALLGFQESQIQAMIHSKHPLPLDEMQRDIDTLAAEPRRLASRSEPFPKINRKHLDLETLHYYNIPYEIDPDPNYIIVLRAMTEEETYPLFKHTRTLRSHSTDRPLSANGQTTLERTCSYGSLLSYLDDRGYSAKDDSVDAQQSESTRSDDTEPSGSMPDIFRPVFRGNSDSEKQHHIPTDASKRARAALCVPSFLAWPSVVETWNKQTDSTDTSGLPRGIQRDESLLVKLTLREIAHRIYQTKDHYRAPLSSTLLIYKSDDVIVEIPKHTCPEKQFHNVNSAPLIPVDGDVHGVYYNFEREFILLRSLDKHGSTDIETDLQPGLTTHTDAEILSEHGNSRLTRRVVYWQAAMLCIERDTLITTLQELICYFVPQDCDHTLVHRCWGAIDVISTILHKSCIDNDMYRNDVPDGESNNTFIVRDLVDKNYRKLHLAEELELSIEQCSCCRKRMQYPDVNDATEHLRRYHVRSSESTSEITRKQLEHWLVPVFSIEREVNNKRLLDFLATLNKYAGKLLARAMDIRSSVANENSQRDSNYLLPTALVKAAEKTFQFVYYSAYSLQSWQDDMFFPAAPRYAPRLFLSESMVTGCEYFAKVADNSMLYARDELMLMAHTGFSQDPILYIPTTPESSLLFTLGFLSDQPLLQNLRILELYREQLVRLRYEASRKPSKRVLREVYLWKEEIEVVMSVMLQQKQAVLALEEVLDSRSFRITNQVRIEAFKELERPSIRNFLKIIRETERDEMPKLNKEADRLAETLRHNIDIAEEGNSKAILVFTLVTIIFLPLSFVSSVFGMNTIDVRDMASTQTLFWAIALPVTAAVGGISLMAAYGGPSYRRFLQEVRKLGVKMQLPTLQRARSEDEEKLDPVGSEDVASARSRSGRRKSRVVNVTKRVMPHRTDTNERKRERRSTRTRFG